MAAFTWIMQHVASAVGEETETAKVYITYQFAMLQRRINPIPQEVFGKLIKQAHPTVQHSTKRIASTFIKVYNGVQLIEPSQEQALHDLNPDIIDDYLPDHYFVFKKTKDTVFVGTFTGDICNESKVMKEIVFESSMWKLKIGSYNVNLPLLHIDPSFICNEYGIKLVCRQVDKVQICHGKLISAKSVIPKRYMKLLWRKEGEGVNHNDLRMKSTFCNGAIQLTAACRGASNTCQKCRRLAAKTDAGADRNENTMLDLTQENLPTILKNIIPNATDQMLNLMVTQAKNINVSDPHGRRWDPNFISTCLTIWTRSPQAYRDLKATKALILPSESLLSYYKNCADQSPGFNRDNLQWMHSEAVRRKIPQEGLQGGLILDEMSIQDDIQLVSKGQYLQMIGFKDMGRESKLMGQIQNKKEEQPIANHVLMFVFLGFKGYRFPVAHFPSTQATAAELYVTFWEGVNKLKLWGFDVLYTNIDGASTNRSLMKMHFQNRDPMTARMIAVSPCNPCQNVIFVMDYSHVIKKIRNGINNSGVKSNRLLTKSDGKTILWQFWVDSYQWDQTNPLQIHRKLTQQHVDLTSATKMRNQLAEEVLNKDMLNLMKEYKKIIRNSCLDAAIELLEATSVLIANFRDPRPITDMGDPRLTENQNSLKWFMDWEKSILSDTNKCTAEKNKALLSVECREDLASCIIGFRELCQARFKCSPGASIIPARVNSDIVENLFSQQRGLHNGASTNPNYFTFQKTMNSIILGQSTISKKSNTGGLSAAEPLVFNTPKALNPRKRKSTSSVQKVKTLRL